MKHSSNSIKIYPSKFQMMTQGQQQRNLPRYTNVCVIYIKFPNSPPIGESHTPADTLDGKVK